MIRDRGGLGNYSLGFGISPADTPINLDPQEEEGVQPESSFIARSLHGHPIMRFLAVSAASLVGMHVASKVVKGGGVRLLDSLERQTVPLVEKEWQTNIVNDFRALQKTLNQWQGAVEVTDAITGEKKLETRVGFWASEADKARAARSRVGEAAEPAESWLWRDELQQALVRQGRRLPYELPAMYATQRFAVDRVVGGDTKEVNWHSPTDVISDFATQSVKNLTSVLAPWEMGQSGLKHGWRKLMTYGDFPSSTSAFAPHLKGFSEGLRGVLSLLGHDASKIIYQGVNKSSKVTGSFASAINQYVGTNRALETKFGVGAVKTTERGGLPGFAINSMYTAQAWTRAMLSHAQTTVQGFRDEGVSYARNNFNAARTFSNFFPKATAFGKAFKNSWGEIGEAEANQEASRAGRKTYLWRGAEKAVNLPWAGERDIRTKFEQYAEGLFHYGGQGPGSRSFRASDFYRERQYDAYRKLIREELEPYLPEGSDAAARFAHGVTIEQLPYDRPTTNVASRLRFGERRSNYSAFGVDSPWHQELQGNLHPIVGEHAGPITERITQAVRGADERFIAMSHAGMGESMSELEANISTTWNRLYSDELIPHIREQIGESKLPFEMFGRNMGQDEMELLVRKAAEASGLSLRDESGYPISATKLTEQLKGLGFKVNDQYDLRNFLVEKGVVAKPWSRSAHNILGLRPLSIQEGIERNYFDPVARGTNEKLLGDIEKGDPYIGSMINRPVGRGVYVTESGNIVDFSNLVNLPRRALNIFQEYFQLPFLHFNPLDIAGYSSARSLSEGSPIRFSGQLGDRRFIQGTEDESTVWLKTGQGIYKPRGKVIGYNAEGTRLLEKSAVPAETDRYRVPGRMMRLGIGDKGQYAPEMREMSGMSRFKKAMAWDPDQRQSLFRYVGRIRDSRRGSLANISNFAKWLQTGDIPGELTDEQLKGYATFMNQLRRPGITSNVARQLEQTVGRDEGAFTHLLAHDRPEFGPGKVSIADVHSPSEMVRIVERTFYEDELAVQKALEAEPNNALLREQATKIRRAQSLIKKRYLKNRSIDRFFDKPTAQAMRSTGIHRRLDELRADMYRYLVAKAEVQGGRPGAITDDLLARLDKLKEERLISGGEYTEARAAALSMQLNNLNLATYQPNISRPEQIQQILTRLRASPRSRSALKDIEKYETQLFHRVGPRKALAQLWRQHFGAAEYEFPGLEYNPFGGNSQYQFVPTFGSTFKRNPWGALKSVTGFNTWSSPESFSSAQLSPLSVSWFYDRLNRYFATFGAGVKETAFKGPQGFFNKGLVGRRVVPAVIAGTTIMAADRTLGGLTSPKDERGHRQYRPLLTGGIATGLAHARVGLAYLPGGKTPQQARSEYFGESEVPVRKGRYWPLGSQRWSGGRVQYFRPNWYRTFMSGYKYTGQDWDSPLEKLAYGADFSPLRPLDPYRWERKHYSDRPYPSTGDYFTGPYGSLTTALNATVGRVVKPHTMMHKPELAAAMSQYQQYGQYAMGVQQPRNIHPVVSARNPTGSVGIFQPRPASEVLGLTPPTQTINFGEGYKSAYKQPYGFVGVPYGTEPREAIGSYLRPRPVLVGGNFNVSGSPEATGIAAINRHYESMAGSPPAQKDLGGAEITSAATAGGGGYGRGKALALRTSQAFALSPSRHVARSALDAVNQHYTDMAFEPPPRSYNPYNRVVMSKTQGFDPRVAPRKNPITQGSLAWQASQFGYETQELFGIYGFAFGSARQALGLGGYDFTPKRPVFQAASRGYGTERSFWDLNLGGLGDFPNLSEGEYGNLEISEIVRRFIPHRRRDVSEINPIPNTVGQQYPWLPGSDYFMNFKQGDPYIQLNMGELRLPGAGYEQTHTLHPDMTGKYGLLDQHHILGNVAPWSPQYRAVDQIIKKMPLTEEEKHFTRITRKQVSTINKRQTFAPYQYAHTNFQRQQAKLTSIDPSDAEILHTTFGTVRLAGVRARSGRQAQNFVRSLIRPGDEINLTYDANRPPASRESPIDVMLNKGSKNINRILLNNPEYAYQAKTSAPIDQRVTDNRLSLALKSQWEMFQHRNTLFHNKFFGKRTAVEDWERNNIYGSTFPTWQHPVRDFLAPITYRAKNRSPITSAIVLAAAGSLFTRQPEGKAAGRLIGAATGFGIGLFSNAKTIETGQRFIPKNRRKEAAVDEYADILNYIKYKRLYNYARERAIDDENSDPEQIAQTIENDKYKRFQFANLGPETSSALAYRKSLQQTLYGADAFGDVMNLANAIPKRKRDHFLEFINAPIDERQRILSTAPRLERRLYEARWGMKVERRPDLNQYFTEHELPPVNWEGWNPNVNIDTVKIKVMRQQGLDVSQSGYYPQQLEEANLLNPSYPDFAHKERPHAVAARLQQLMRMQNINGSVVAVPSAFPGIRTQLQAGVG